MEERVHLQTHVCVLQASLDASVRQVNMPSFLFNSVLNHIMKAFPEHLGSLSI